MSCFSRRCCAALLCLLVISSATAGYGAQFVRLDYSLTLNARSRNTAFIEVFDIDRPATSNNFMQYVNGGRYDGSFMHRLDHDFVIQGGGFYPVPISEAPPLYVSLNPTATVDLDGNLATPNPTVNNEYGNSPTRSNLRGTLAMARAPGQPNSATNQWFVNLDDNINLNGIDGGFTVFAKVVGDGMALFDSFNILATPQNPNGISIINMNPDADNNGVRDSGPFFRNSTDGVPAIVSQSGLITLIVLNEAQRVDYLGAGSITSVPDGGLAFTARDVFVDTGANFTGAGNRSIAIGAGRTFGIRENYELNRALVNNGTLAPGLQLGEVKVASYLQTATGTLDIQLRGTNIGIDYDSLFVVGTASLAGKIDVSLINQYMPVHGNEFTILSAAALSTNAPTIDLPQLTAGLVWSVTTTNTAITLHVAKADFNQDGVVSAADYVVWRDTMNRTGAGLAADANGDLVVNAADLAIWKGNFGNIRGNVAAGSGASAAVPEPSALSLCALLAAIVMWRCHRRVAA